MVQGFPAWVCSSFSTGCGFHVPGVVNSNLSRVTGLAGSVYGQVAIAVVSLPRTMIFREGKDSTGENGHKAHRHH